MNLQSLLPNRNLLVLDAGSRCIKILEVAVALGQLRIRNHRLIDLPPGDELTAGELNRLIDEMFGKWGSHQVVISLPQHLSISQLIELPATAPDAVREVIEDETVKLSGLSESAIVFDYGPLKPFGRCRNPYWVTFAREEEVLNEISRVAAVGEFLCEVTTVANALVAAYQTLHPEPDNALLVEIGAGSTVVAIVAAGQCVYAGSFPVGGEFFTESIATQRNCSPTAAAVLKATQNVLEGELTLPGFQSVLDGWRTEVERILKDWLEDHPETGVAADSFRVLLSGGATAQPGLLDYLNRPGARPFQLWSALATTPDELPMDRFAVAYGLAAKHLFRLPPASSLFPPDLRAVRKERREANVWQSGVWAVLVIAFLLLAFGTWQKSALIRRKSSALNDAQTLLEEVRKVHTLNVQVLNSYERLRPILREQQHSLDQLRTLALMQKIRGDRRLWYVLFADQDSYYTAPLPPPPPGTNPPPAAPVISTNDNLLLPRPPYGFVAEVSLQEEGETMRQTLSQVVTELKHSPLIKAVDALPADRRRALANPTVVIPDRHFALAIELSGSSFEEPLPLPAMKTVTNKLKGFLTPSNRPPRAGQPDPRATTNHTGTNRFRLRK